MFEDAVVVAEFVFSQLLAPKDALAIIDGLLEELAGEGEPVAVVPCEGDAPPVVPSKLNSSTFLAKALDINIDRSAPHAPKRRRTLPHQRNGAARERHARAQLARELKQDCKEYAVKASKVG